MIVHFDRKVNRRKEGGRFEIEKFKDLFHL